MFTYYIGIVIFICCEVFVRLQSKQIAMHHNKKHWMTSSVPCTLQKLQCQTSGIAQSWYKRCDIESRKTIPYSLELIDFNLMAIV